MFRRVLSWLARPLEGLDARPGLDPEDRDAAALGAFAAVALASSRARSLDTLYGVSRRVRPGSVEAAGTLFLLDLLDRVRARRPEYFAALPPGPDVLDVGTRDFDSALALFLFFSRDPETGRAGPAPRLTGIELEPERRDEFGASWRARAEARLRRLPPSSRGRSRFLGGDVLEHQERHDFVTWFHPFVDDARLRAWGLAPEFFRPRELLAHVFERLRPGGSLLVVNQDADEDQAQRGLFDALGLEHDSFSVELSLRARDQPAHVHLARR